jgi:site-specific DNA recombinase
MAQREGFEVVAVHADEGVSGAAKVRPAFNSWLADARDGRADVLLAWDWSRISREGLTGVGRILETLEESGARLLTLRDRVDSQSPAFELIAAVMASTAKAERTAIRERVLSRQRHDRASGRWTRGAPWAYEVDNGTLVPILDRVEIVRQVITRYLDGGSLRSCAAWLNDQGVPPRKAALWGTSSVRYLLRSPVLFGGLPHKSGFVRGEDGAPLLVVSDPILTFAQWRALQDRLDLGGEAARGRVAKSSNPLRGFVFCGLCDGPMALDSKSAGLRCTRHATTPGACVGVRVDLDVARASVVEDLLGYLAALEPDSDEAGRIAERWLAAVEPEQSADVTAARAEVEEAEALVADLEAARYVRGEFPGDAGRARWDALYRKATARWEAARDALTASEPVALDMTAVLDATLVVDAVDDSEALRDLLRVVGLSWKLSEDSQAERR